MPAASWRIIPARSISRCEAISASFGVSRRIGRKKRDRRMGIRLAECGRRGSSESGWGAKTQPLNGPQKRGDTRPAYKARVRLRYNVAPQDEYFTASCVRYVTNEICWATVISSRGTIRRWTSAVQVLGGQSIGAVTRCLARKKAATPGFMDNEEI